MLSFSPVVSSPLSHPWPTLLRRLHLPVFSVTLFSVQSRFFEENLWILFSSRKLPVPLSLAPAARVGVSSFSANVAHFPHLFGPSLHPIPSPFPNQKSLSLLPHPSLSLSLSLSLPLCLSSTGRVELQLRRPWPEFYRPMARYAMPRHATPRYTPLSTERKREGGRGEMQVLSFIQPPLERLERLRGYARTCCGPRNSAETSSRGLLGGKINGRLIRVFSSLALSSLFSPINKLLRWKINFDLRI